MYNRTQLEDQLEELLNTLHALDLREPEDMDCEAYDLWAEEHEDLEDLIDDIRDRLDALK